MSEKGPRKKDQSVAAAPRVGFDECLSKLESIVAELEAGGLGLEPAIERYREGVELLKGCREILGAYRRQVEELTQGAELVLRPYEGDPDVQDAPGHAPRRA